MIFINKLLLLLKNYYYYYYYYSDKLSDHLVRQSVIRLEIVRSTLTECPIS